ncbi:Glycoside hydrolase family 18, catalytic domain [Dillenia turbinata]|uniref:Glycoside hydrolase family 18, catalytic domain n=1 Tax=Dillenia turbinata TaxID=194707 RepID=A0AAN8ZPT7_9MAGN
MASLRLPRFLFFFFFLFLAMATGSVMGSHKAVKGAYYPDWASGLPPSSIDTSLFTHIYYAFVQPNNVTFELDVSDSLATTLSNFSSTLHSKNPPVKTLISLGGAGSSVFSSMASSASTRKSFILSTIQVARNLGFDGLDLDWEFPQNPAEMDNFASLLEEWRAEVQKEAQETHRVPLLLTAAVYFSVDFFLSDVYRIYPVESMSKNLDLVHAMCYDYHGSWNTSATGAQAALFDPNSNISTSYGLNSWLKAGLPRSKLVMGLPLYGRTWTLKDPKVNGVGAPAVAVGPGDDGVLIYNQILNYNKEHNATVKFDMTTVSAYSYVGTAWIGYDDTRSTPLKVNYAQALGIRGYFFWALSYDHDWMIATKASRAWLL